MVTVDLSQIAALLEGYQSATPLNQALTTDTILADPEDPTSLVLSPDKVFPVKIGKEIHLVYGDTHGKSKRKTSHPLQNIAKYSMLGVIREEGRNMDILGPKPPSPRDGAVSIIFPLPYVNTYFLGRFLRTN
jgi:hypothetical protein